MKVINLDMTIAVVVAGYRAPGMQVTGFRLQGQVTGFRLQGQVAGVNISNLKTRAAPPVTGTGNL